MVSPKYRKSIYTHDRLSAPSACPVQLFILVRYWVSIREATEESCDQIILVTGSKFETEDFEDFPRRISYAGHCGILQAVKPGCRDQSMLSEFSENVYITLYSCLAFAPLHSWKLAPRNNRPPRGTLFYYQAPHFYCGESLSGSIERLSLHLMSHNIKKSSGNWRDSASAYHAFEYWNNVRTEWVGILVYTLSMHTYLCTEYCI